MTNQNGWSSSNPFLRENEQPSYSSDVPRRAQSVSHRSSRSHKSNPFRPEYQRSFSSDPFLDPLDKIREEQKTANRSPHLRKFVPTDTIDNLDTTGLGPYHHEGPYDATLASRQIPGRAPLEAVKYGNAAALAATPTANVIDSLTRKVPLQGVALVPPGGVGPGGQRFDYEEEDIMHVDGKLGRWPGVAYRDKDIKGKGEPGYTGDLLEKEIKARRKQEIGNPIHGDSGGAIEMQNHTGRKRSVSDVNPRVRYEPLNVVETSGIDASNPGKFHTLKKRFSLRRKKTRV